MRKVNPQCGIYQITNTVNGKFYIGSTNSLVNRKRSHLYCLRHGVHGNSHLQNAFNKYGEQAFLFELIEYCQENELLMVEQKLIDERKPEYNQRVIAESNRGIKWTDETKRKWSKQRKGKPLGPFTEEHKRNISLSHIGNQWNVGHIVTPETREKIANSHRGKHLTEEHKRKVGIAMTGRKFSEETIAKMSVAGRQRWIDRKAKYWSDVT